MLFVLEKWSELPFQYLSLQNFLGGACSQTPLGWLVLWASRPVANGHHCFGNPFSSDPATPL